MVQNGELPEWATSSVEFLSNNLPTIPELDGWRHDFATAYQIASNALIMLGQAEEREWGTVRLPNPQFPEILPRWDDICIAVLWLAEQNGRIDYRALDGSPPSPVVTLDHGGKTVKYLIVPHSPPPAPNISASQALGPAFVKPDSIDVLERLGVLDSGKWSDRGETLFWRVQPKEWAMDVKSDGRFLEAVERAVVTLPNDIRAEMDRLVTISEEDVAAAMSKTAADIEKHRAAYGPKARISGPDTPEMARRSLEFRRRGEFDWMFFRSWRLDDGWLGPHAAERALEIFHDPLAIAMRRAVTDRIYPDSSFAAL